jgi:hypothetical protein
MSVNLSASNPSLYDFLHTKYKVFKDHVEHDRSEQSTMSSGALVVFSSMKKRVAEEEQKNKATSIANLLTKFKAFSQHFIIGTYATETDMQELLLAINAIRDGTLGGSAQLATARVEVAGGAVASASGGSAVSFRQSAFKKPPAKPQTQPTDRSVPVQKATVNVQAPNPGTAANATAASKPAQPTFAPSRPLVTVQKFPSNLEHEAKLQSEVDPVGDLIKQFKEIDYSLFERRVEARDGNVQYDEIGAWIEFDKQLEAIANDAIAQMARGLKEENRKRYDLIFNEVVHLRKRLGQAIDVMMDCFEAFAKEKIANSIKRKETNLK